MTKGREKDFIPRGQRFFELPPDAIPSSDVDREFDIAKSRFPVIYGDEQWAKPGTPTQVEPLRYAFEMVRARNPNLVEPTMFLGAWEMEREAVSMIAQLFHHPRSDEEDFNTGEKAVLGWFTDGGTGSLLQAAWAFRNAYFRNREKGADNNFNRERDRGTVRDEGLLGLVQRELVAAHDPPVVLASVDAHIAIDKVCDVLGLGTHNIVRYGLNKKYRTDYAALEETIQELTKKKRKVMFTLATAGAVNTGRVEDVQKLSKVLQKYSIDSPIIVDAAQQFMMISLLEGYPAWDFRVEQVKAIIADPHKTDAAPYPGSVILFRDESVVHDTSNDVGYLHAGDPLGYDLKKAWMLEPSFQTSRSPIGAIATWAYFLLNGRKKLVEQYQRLYTITQAMIAEYIKTSDHFRLLGEPQTGLVSFHLKDGDDEKAQRVYDQFVAIRDRPRFFIGFADNSRVRTIDDFKKYEKLKREHPGEKVRGYGGLSIQVMHHATEKLAEGLLEKLDQFGYEATRGKISLGGRT